MKVEIYWNIRKKCYSVRRGGKVIDRGEDFLLRDVTFVVQPAGRERVLREGRKNVHAFLRGSLAPLSECRVKVGECESIGYNPYREGHWTAGLERREVSRADECLLTTRFGKPCVLAGGVV